MAWRLLLMLKDCQSLLCWIHHLVGLVERRLPRGRLDPEITPCFSRQAIPVTLKLVPKWLPCQALCVTELTLELVGLVSVWCEWGTQQRWSAIYFSIWQHIQLSSEIRCWDVKWLRKNPDYLCRTRTPEHMFGATSGWRKGTFSKKAGIVDNIALCITYCFANVSQSLILIPIVFRQSYSLSQSLLLLYQKELCVNQNWMFGHCAIFYLVIRPHSTTPPPSFVFIFWYFAPTVIWCTQFNSLTMYKTRMGGNSPIRMQKQGCAMGHLRINTPSWMQETRLKENLAHNKHHFLP